MKGNVMSKRIEAINSEVNTGEMLGELEKRSDELKREQLGMALEFYDVEGDSDVSRYYHRQITEQMTMNGIDLMLPTLVKEMQTKGKNRVMLVAPLRGAMAMVTPAIVAHWQKRFGEVGMEVGVELAALGIKRDAVTATADIYFEAGFDEKEDDSRTHFVFPDWGTATGATIKTGAEWVKEKLGVSFGQMTVLSMTMAAEAKERIGSCVDEGGVIGIEHATLAKLNEVGYVNWIRSESGDSWSEVTPKDWGAKMFGMEIEEDQVGEVARQVEMFVREARVVFDGKVGLAQLERLREYYLQKYVR